MGGKQSGYRIKFKKVKKSCLICGKYGRRNTNQNQLNEFVK